MPCPEKDVDLPLLIQAIGGLQLHTFEICQHQEVEGRKPNHEHCLLCLFSLDDIGMAECNQKKVMRTALRSHQRTSASAHTRGGSLEGTPTDRCTPGAVSAPARPLGAGSGDAGVWSCFGEARLPVMSAAMWPKKPTLHLSCVDGLAHGGSCSSSAACVCGKPARTQQFWGPTASRPTDAQTACHRKQQ